MLGKVYSNMVKEKIVFDCEDSLQMKTVAVLIQKASQYRSTIYLIRSGRRANARLKCFGNRKK